MMKSLCFALVALTAACGDDGGKGGGGGSADAPSNVPAMITVSGVTTQITATGKTPLADVTVKAFKTGSDSTPIAMATSDSAGAFTLSAPTGGVPFDGYLVATSSGNLDSYLYPPKALSADFTGVPVFILDDSTRSAAAFIGGAKQDPGMAFVALEVLDSSNAGIKGATVNVTPGGGMIRYNGTKNGATTGLPDSAATATQEDGIAYIFDQASGDAMIGATAAGNTIAPHKVNARADVVTLTIVQ